MTVKQAIKLGAEKLKGDTPLLDSQVLLMHSAKQNSVNLSKVKLYTEPDLVLSEEIEGLYLKCLDRRLKSEPVQYITGECEFMGMDFEVNKYTLIPRPDTEILVESAIEYINKSNVKTVLDMCTGSGAIAVSICSFCGDIEMFASDISENAVKTAKRNAERNNVSKQINFAVGSLFEPVKEKKFDLILSNPPYIPSGEIKSLEKNVKDFEPLSALDGGADGLSFYYAITENAKKHLNCGGRIYYEIGYDQKDSVSNILADNGFCNINTIKDLNGLNRVVYGDKNSEV